MCGGLPPPGGAPPLNASTPAAWAEYAAAWAANTSLHPVPRILHQTWRSCALPPQQAALRERCRRLLSPRWQLPLWTDAENDALVRAEFARLHPTYARYAPPIKRADAVRLLYLWAYGGVYMDTDSTCLRTLEALPLADGEAVLSYQQRARRAPDAVGNAFLAAPPRHPFVGFLIGRLAAAARRPVQAAAGPYFVTAAVRAWGEVWRAPPLGVRVLEMGRVYTSRWDEANPCGGTPSEAQLDECARRLPQAVATTLWLASWDAALARRGAAARAAAAGGGGGRRMREEGACVRWRRAEGWQPAEVIGAAERAREALRVPFYVYDVDLLPSVSVEATLAAVHACVSRSDHPHVGEYHFLRAAASHRWRVRTPEAAALLVLPLLLGVEAAGLCGYDSRAALAAITNTSLWRERRAEHLLVGTHWQISAGRMPYATTRLPSTALLWAHYEAYAPSFDARRARNEWERQLIADRARVRQTFAAPYAEHRTPPLPAAPRRDVRYFFGGYTSTAHRGYEVRWAMFRRRAALPNRTWLLAEPKDAVVPLPACERRALAPPAAGSLACAGKYVAARMVGRAVFALAPRGDTPTSRRLSDAVLYGAIPVFISDSVLEVGAPFRCLVPYSLFTMSVGERHFMRDPAGALRPVENLTDRQVERMQALIAHFRRDLLWRHPESRVAENVLIEAFRVRSAAAGRSGPCCPFET